MPGPIPDERTGLLAFLEQQRYVLRVAAHGLSDEQARTAVAPSGLSVGGLIKHVASTESGWLDTIEQTTAGDESDYEDGFRLGPRETLEGAIATYADVAARTQRIVDEIGDLDHTVPVPKGVPWFPDDVDAWSLRWVLLHLIEETARHAGHADLVRESLDGATAFPLMAALEGWPATPWMQPWAPD